MDLSPLPPPLGVHTIRPRGSRTTALPSGSAQASGRQCESRCSERPWRGWARRWRDGWLWGMEEG